MNNQRGTYKFYFAEIYDFTYCSNIKNYIHVD